MTTIDLVYFNAGGGHRAAALALQEAIRRQGRPWQVRLVNLTEVLDPQDRFRRMTGLAPEDLYNKRLARGWTLGLAQELKLLQGLIRLSHGGLVDRLQQHWLATEPDLVVSLVPNFNQALRDALASTLPGVPFVTVMTDLADLPPHFWIEPGGHQHLVVGTPMALAQARAAGLGRDQVTLTSGMLLHPSFYDPPPSESERATRLRALGLNPDQPTGVVMFGGQGSTQMLAIAKALRDRQLILMCGRNEALVERLLARRPRAPHVVLGFTTEVGRTLRLGDYFIGKPGPGSLSEALHLGLPVITFNNAWTMPQERYNTEWLREQRLGVVLPSVRGLAQAVDGLLPALGVHRLRVAQLNNRAVFEVPQVLARLLDEADGVDGATAPCLARAPSDVAPDPQSG